MKSISAVAVIGAGTMGHGIAYAALAAGYDVAIADASLETLQRGEAMIAAAFAKAIERGKLTAAQRDEAIGRLSSFSSPAEAVTGADLVIEAVPEQLALKQKLLADLESQVDDDTILGTNTSSLSVAEIGRGLRRKGRFVGTHFFNPVPAMKLLELVRAADTSDDTVAAARAFGERLGKTVILVKDSPGFATSRLGVVLGLEAMRMVEQGVASAEDIDRAMELGYNHPMGPLKLTDVVGLDVRLAIAEHLHRTLGDDTYRPPELLRAMVAQGKLGKKSGQGFYRWESER